DGAAAARLLAIAGARVNVVLLGKVGDTKGDARTNFERLGSLQDEPAESQGAFNLYECESETVWNQLLESILKVPHDANIDALFGTGFTRPVAGIHKEAIKYLRQLRRLRDSPEHLYSPIVSVDLPSGLNSGSTGVIGETVYADVTVTMTAPKIANVLPPA